MQNAYPRIVRNGSMHAVALGQSDNGIKLLGMFDTGGYTTQLHNAATFARNWFDVDDVNKLGRKTPTVEAYLAAVAKTRLTVDQTAIDAIRSLMKEMTMIHVYVTSKGTIHQAPAADAIELDTAKSLEDNVALLEKHLSERALAHFTNGALKLTQVLARVKRGDKRVVEAIKTVLNAHNAKPIANAAAAAIEAKATKTTTQPANDDATDDKKTTTAKQPKPRGAGARTALYGLLVAGKKGTVEDFVAMIPGSSQSNVRTMLSDFKNPKYAPEGKALNIVKDEKGVFAVKK